MNKRQKIVQQQFLNNEEAVIRMLKDVYNQALNDITKKSEELQNSINMLTMNTLSGEMDEAAKAQLQSMIQSKVYQKQYQDALKKQISSILDNMQVEEFKTVEEYLIKCYEEGFIGTMYDLQGQGIPLVFPIDQEAVVRAVQIDSKISNGLYARLGEDVGILKRKITATVSRGIATGMSFQLMAKQLSGYTSIGFNNAVRIARTEGHRIQVQSGMNACFKAKEKGADVVKQWDSTQDGRTRPSHRQIDGEVRELDEPFSNGLMFPGDPSGSAAEVVNCRCALFQRARLALDEDELDTLKERAEYYGLDKADNFRDFKKKYIKAAEDIVKNPESGNIKMNLQLFAKMPEEKFTKYSLNPLKEPNKAKAFKEALGYDLDNYNELMDNINSHIDEKKFVEKGDSGHGMRYEYIIELTGANGKKANVLTAWIDDKEDKRLTSVYVTKKKVTE